MNKLYFKLEPQLQSSSCLVPYPSKYVHTVPNCTVYKTSCSRSSGTNWVPVNLRPLFLKSPLCPSLPQYFYQAEDVIFSSYLRPTEPDWPVTTYVVTGQLTVMKPCHSWILPAFPLVGAPVWLFWSAYSLRSWMCTVLLTSRLSHLKHLIRILQYVQVKGTCGVQGEDTCQAGLMVKFTNMYVV